MIGIILVVFGFFLLARNLGLLGDIDWGIVWPTMMIIFGILLLIRHRQHHSVGWWGSCCHGSSCDYDNEERVVSKKK